MVSLIVVLLCSVDQEQVVPPSTVLIYRSFSEETGKVTSVLVVSRRLREVSWTVFFTFFDCTLDYILYIHEGGFMSSHGLSV